MQRASGLFTWTATVCQFIQERGQFVVDRQRAVLDDGYVTDNSPKDSSPSEDSCAVDQIDILPKKRLNSKHFTVLVSLVREYRKQGRKKRDKFMKNNSEAIALLYSTGTEPPSTSAPLFFP